MDMKNCDWNEVWREARARTCFPEHDRKFWDRRAPSFTRHAGKSDYIGQFMRIMNAKPHWSVLDIGSGAGTLAVPLAGSVRRITAMDPSDTMRSLLEERCSREGISNIRVVNGRWEDDWEEKGIGMHDVVIASRSMVVEDLRSAIVKLDAHARERVYISTLVGDGPHDRHILQAAGRKFWQGPDYICVCNLLYQMGIFANLTFTINEEDRRFGSVEEAFESVRWMIDQMTPDEEEMLKKFLREYLVLEDGRWRLPRPRVVRWAVLWWEKNGTVPGK